jgi:hypothetical protein
MLRCAQHGRAGYVAPSLLAALLLLVAGCGPEDTVSPEARLVFPVDQSVLAPDTYTIVAVTSDDRAVWRVSFWQDSLMLGFFYSVESDTFRCRWDCRGDSGGTEHMLQVEATDRAQNHAFAQSHVIVRP